jgi:hypothetical protein
MQRVESDAAGFAVDFDVAARAVHIEAWGFWPAPVCAAFGHGVIDACRKALGARRLEMEADRLKPLREEGENAWALVLSSLPASIEAFVVRTNSLTKLQLMRIARASRDKNVVQFL